MNAGIALTLRTARFAHSGIVEAPRELGLPQVPMAEFAIRLRAGADGSAADLATLLSGNLALSPAECPKKEPTLRSATAKKKPTLRSAWK